MNKISESRVLFQKKTSKDWLKTYELKKTIDN